MPIVDCDAPHLCRAAVTRTSLSFLWIPRSWPLSLSLILSLLRFSQFAIRQTAYYFENANRFEADLLMQLGRGVRRGTAEDAETTEQTMQKLSPKTKPKPRKTLAEQGKGKKRRKKERGKRRERRAGNNGILVLNCSDLYT